MAFDKSKPHGESLGGDGHPTHGHFVQDGKTYRPDGVEVDGKTGVPLKTEAAKPPKTPAAPPPAATVPAEVVAETK